MNEIKNEVIVIGGNHHNLLGVVRTLGENGINSIAIITNESKYAFTKKSKYIKKAIVIIQDEQIILKELQNFTKFEYKPILIPTSDFAEYVIDKNLDMLKNFFIIPNINNKQGEIIKLMDKFKQTKLAEQYNINFAKSINIDLKEIIEDKYNNINYPCILKPEVSIEGEKADITICNNKDEFILALNSFKDKKYERILVQDYINFETECVLCGICFGEKIIIPGAIFKKRRYPKNKGNVSYGTVEPLENLNVDLQYLYELLKSLNYYGMFDIEIFLKNKSFYLNEINFRNSGNSYAFGAANVHLIYLYVLLASGKNILKEKVKVDSIITFVDENLEILQLLKRNIKFKEWLVARRKTSSFFIKNKNDKAPAKWKKIYAIMRRIDKNGF